MKHAATSRPGLHADARATPRAAAPKLGAAVLPAIFWVAVFSFFVNLLSLALPLFMWQLFDRVLSSRSVETLVMLTLITAGAFLAQGALELVRNRVLAHVGTWLDLRLGPRLVQGLFGYRAAGHTGGGRVLRQIDALKTFLTGPPILHLLDALWTPVFVGALYLMHPLLGTVAGIGILLFLSLVLLTEWLTRGPLARFNVARGSAMERLDGRLAAAETVVSMGMATPLAQEWQGELGRWAESQQAAGRRSATLHAMAKTLRLLLQIIVLGLGAWLVLTHAATAGIMIAAAIILSKAFAPVEHLLGSWRHFVAARQAWRDLKALLQAVATEAPVRRLAAPRGRLTAERLSVTVAGREMPLLWDVNFTLEPGESLAVIGPSASGKTTLARACAGLVPPQGGRVRLDGADIARWDKGELGPHLGYMPQDSAPLPGTVRENIGRMGLCDDDAVFAAAMEVGLHDAILRLPQGYDTPLTPGSNLLAGGQKALLALARAICGQPRLVVLDEPNAGLDHAGETALRRVIDRCKQAGTTLVLVTHRVQLLPAVDQVLKLAAGKVIAQGDSATLLERARLELVARNARAATPQQVAP